MTLTTRTPPSVSCQTIPSNVTDVPGSHGPRQSGSVIVPTDVPTQISTMSRGSHLIFFAGGGLVLSSRFDDDDDDELTVADVADDVDEFVDDNKPVATLLLLPIVDDNFPPVPIGVVTVTVDDIIPDAVETEFADAELFVFPMLLLLAAVKDVVVVVVDAVEPVDIVDGPVGIIDAEDGSGGGGGC